ncbi:putative protein phosphatase 2C 10 [Glycine soja]|uniref:PPM-type phosphatase domain-containing protein n=1 Tax=Glycine soja TaxID=3848 RepID=A0A445HCN7_GLYSO|nr:putative protein phosphatase 2C 10 [Glycine soja]
MRTSSNSQLESLLWTLRPVASIWEACPKPIDGLWAPWWYKTVHKSTGFKEENKYPQVVGGRSSCNSGKGNSNHSSVKYGYSLVKGKANHPMEDYHVAKFVQFKGRELGLFAIYDGHLGDSVPAYLQKHMFSNILKEEDFWNDPFMSISNAYETTNQEILSHRQGGVAGQMSIDHEPNIERGSIETRGGFVSNMPVMVRGNEDDGIRRQGHKYERRWQEYKRFKEDRQESEEDEHSFEIRILQQQFSKKRR